MILTDRHPPLRKKKRVTPILKPVVPFPIELVVDPWAEEHGILLIGTHQDASDIYYDGFDESLTVDPTTVNGYEKAVEGLKQLPNHVIVAMEPQYNNYTKLMETKAVYFSTAPNRGYALIMPKDYSDKYLLGIHPGFILEQKSCNWAKFALHEYGHTVDYLGITGEYKWETIWKNLSDERNRIFDAEGELISGYAKTNPREDFAEHFAYYVWKGTTFRERMPENLDLQARYYFLKDYLFQGIEYEEPPPPPVTVLEGYIVDNRGKPIEGGRIYAKRVDVEVYFADSDETGYFYSEGRLVEGEWIIWAEKGGYIKSEEITILLTVGVPVEVTLVMRQQRPSLLWLAIPIIVIGTGGIIYLYQRK